ncbi:MAG TPA: Mur ligase family protein [Candidatus Saccharimonadales bacterium]|jgi:UDP-N-acetylmuramyl pentapeptide synthase
MKQFNQFVRSASALYAPGYLSSLVWLLESTRYSIHLYLARFWSTQDFSTLTGKRPTPTSRNRALVMFVMLGSLLQTMLGLALLVYALQRDMPEATWFGLALVVSSPIVWAHALALFYAAYKLLWSVLHPKTTGRAIVCKILEKQVVQLRAKHQFTMIAVAGSIGKTSTKLAIAHTLEPSRRVIYQTGNYNDRVTVPLVLFGQKLPNLFNLVAWIKIFMANERAIKRPHYYDVAVVELGTDHPGDMKHFAYLKPDITIVTAITPEHMEYFGTLDAVAAEELTVCDYSKTVLINADDTPLQYVSDKNMQTYGTEQTCDYQASNYNPDGLRGGKVTLRLQSGVTLEPQVAILGAQGVKIVLAAAAAAQLAGLPGDEIARGLAEVKPFAGRMQILRGIRGSTIIDDTYNASPVAVTAGLDVLYATPAPQRIAVLGTMNELGDYSEAAHVEVGKYCDASKLDLVVTIGDNAAKYLAPAARAHGCHVKTFSSPYEAGLYIREHVQHGAVVLAEGSQNRVFAEESLKLLLADPADAKKLVRQSAYWMRVKAKQFGPVPHVTEVESTTPPPVLS